MFAFLNDWSKKDGLSHSFLEENGAVANAPNTETNGFENLE